MPINTTNRKLKTLENAARTHKDGVTEYLPGRSETQKIGMVSIGAIDTTGIGLGADSAKAQEVTHSCMLQMILFVQYMIKFENLSIE